MIRALPPSTTGQPTECAIIRNSRPKAPVSGAVSGPHGVRGRAGQQRPGLLAAEPPRQDAGGQHALQAEAGHGQRVAGD